MLLAVLHEGLLVELRARGWVQVFRVIGHHHRAEFGLAHDRGVIDASQHRWKDWTDGSYMPRCLFSDQFSYGAGSLDWLLSRELLQSEQIKRGMVSSLSCNWIHLLVQVVLVRIMIKVWGLDLWQARYGHAHRKGLVAGWHMLMREICCVLLHTLVKWIVVTRNSSLMALKLDHTLKDFT